MDLEITGNILAWTGYLILGGLVLAAVLLWLDTIRLHFQSVRAGVPLPTALILVLKLRRARPSKMIAALRKCREAGVTVDLDELESLYRGSPRGFDSNVQHLIASRLAGRGSSAGMGQA
jgi:uncharacterized protein YqfA (UPF0365 family)